MFRTTNQISLESMVPHCRAWHWAAQHVQRDRRHNVGSPWTHQWTDRQSLWPVIWGWLNIGNAWECHNLWLNVHAENGWEWWSTFRFGCFTGSDFFRTHSPHPWVSCAGFKVGPRWTNSGRRIGLGNVYRTWIAFYMFLHPFIWVWINTYYIIPFFGGMNIHLPAILMFTRGTRSWHTAISRFSMQIFTSTTSRV